MLHRRGIPLLTRTIIVLLLVGLFPLHVSHGQDGASPATIAAVDAALGTAFTYQGTLKHGGQPVDGVCTFKLSLWDAAIQGAMQGAEQTIANVSVQAGAFALQVDFGNQFTGPARWLQTKVQCAGEGEATTLSPRQPVHAVPYAMGLRPGAVMQSAAPGNAFSVEISAANSAAIHGKATGAEGVGVLGESATWAGVWGESQGASGVVGISAAQYSGGVYGENTGLGNGVIGKATTASGVVGTSSGEFNAGVYGRNDGGGYGVYGESVYSGGVVGESELWVGVYGVTTGIHEEGATPEFGGVFGEAHGYAPGVLATSSNGSGVYTTGERGVEAVGKKWGVLAKSAESTGVGVYGGHTADSGTYPGIFAESKSGAQHAVALLALLQHENPGPSSAAIKAVNLGSGASGIGVWGEQEGSGYGVYGRTPFGGYGVVGESPSPGYAGYFIGNVHVTGTLSKGGGSFKIDHPLDPANKYLSHSFVESPDMMNIYNGNVVTDAAGYATITLPDYFEALNRDFRYQLTVIGRFAQAIVVDEIQGNQFRIQTDVPGVKVSWQVTGIRHDPFAEANRIPVEEEKTGDARGRYLYPEVYGEGAQAGIWYGASANARAMVDDPAAATNFAPLQEAAK